MVKKKIIVWIVIIIFLLSLIGTVFFFTRQTIIVENTKQQLKEQGFITIWASPIDDSFSNMDFCGTSSQSTETEYEKSIEEIKEKGFGCTQFQPNFESTKRYHETEKFVLTSWTPHNYNTYPEQISIGAKIELWTKQKFKGQEVVIFGRGTCNINPTGYGFGATRNQVFKLIPHTFDTSIYDLEIDGIKVKEFNVGEGFNLHFSCPNKENWAVIHLISFKPDISCNIEKNDVPLSETFDHTFKKISRENLRFTPMKYCDDTRPFTLRNLTGGEKAIKRREGELPFSQGKEIPLVRDLIEGESITINYYTTMVEGLLNPLTPSQTWSCTARDSEGKCSDWGIKEYIKPVEVIIQQCKKETENQDCPRFTDMPDCFQGCQNNKCEYAEDVRCQNRIVSYIRQVEFISETIIIEGSPENLFSFSQNKDTNSFMFGDEKFTADKLSYKCTMPSDEGFYGVPYGGKECWGTTISFMGKDYKVNHLDEIKINDYITLKYIASGTLKIVHDENSFFEGIPDNNWGNTFYFILKDALEFEVLDEKNERVILHNSDKKIKIRITNNLPRNTKAFVRFKQIHEQVSPERLVIEKIIPIVFEEGANNLEIEDFDSSFLDNSRAEIKPIYKIQSNKEILLPSNPKTLKPKYLVVTEIPENIDDIIDKEFLIIEKEVIKEVDRPIKETITVEKIPAYIWWIIGTFVIIIIALIIFLILRKKKESNKN